MFTLIFWVFLHLFKKKPRSIQEGYFCTCNNELVKFGEICESCGKKSLVPVNPMKIEHCEYCGARHCENCGAMLCEYCCIKSKNSSLNV